MKVVPPFLRTAFNYDRNAAGDESGLSCLDGSLAKQAFADECDINTLVRRFGVTGELPTGVRLPSYGDFTGIRDFHQAVNAVATAHEAFDAMPADVRARFHNDPGEFLAFFDKAENRPEALRLGLLVPQAAALASSPAKPGEAVVAPSGATKEAVSKPGAQSST